MSSNYFAMWHWSAVKAEIFKFVMWRSHCCVTNPMAITRNVYKKQITPEVFKAGMKLLEAARHKQ